MGSPSENWKVSTIFPGRFICWTCGAPVEPQYLNWKGVCMKCDDKLQTGRALIGLMSEDVLPTTKTGFAQVLQQLKKGTSPAMVGMAEAILQEAGGHEAIGKAIWEDLKKIRGEGLKDWEQVTHVTDYKVLKGMYDLIQRIMSTRDEMVGNAGDPLDGLDEQDLLMVAAEAAKVRITTDPDFRLEMLALIDQTDPTLIEDRYMARFGIPMVMVRNAAGTV